MAGDWIKMRVGLGDEPEVIGIAALTDLDEDHVIGKLLRLWGWADQKTVDGNASSVTEKWIDRYVGVTGFAAAMVKVGWLILHDKGVCFPDFDKHNTESGKRRALTARRTAKHRRKSDAPTVTKSVPTEEKRRKEKNEDKKPPKSPKGDPVLEMAIPEALDTEGFRAAWLRWQKHRREIKKPLKPTQAAAQLDKMAGMGPKAAIAMIEHTIEKGWQGLREPDARQGDNSDGSESVDFRKLDKDLKI